MENKWPSPQADEDDAQAAQVAKLSPDSEREALFWIEAVSEFDGDDPR
jgi:hypothetical protein